MARILLVEDDLQLRSSVERWLKSKLHNVDTAGDGDLALQLAGDHTFDLVILDWELPGTAGPEVCQRFRARGGRTPVLMLTARKTIDDKVIGLNCGADDYLTKPFDLREFEARIEALLRRPPVMLQPQIVVGDLIIDLQRKCVTRNGEDITLFPQEFILLEFFARHPNTVFSADVLLQRAWAPNTEASPDAVRTCIKTLRRKIDKNGSARIHTVYGVGYEFIVAGKQP